MFLSRLVLDTRNRAVRRDQGDCHDLHRTLLRAFPQAPAGEGGREFAGLLFRTEPEPAAAFPETPNAENWAPLVVLAQSRLVPNWELLPPGYLRPGGAAVKEFDGGPAALPAGSTLRFRLRANPTRSVPPPDAAGRFGRGQRRSILFGPQAQPDGLSAEQRCLDWLAHKGEGCGFTLATVAARGVAAGVEEVPDVRVGLEDALRGWRQDAARDGARKPLTLRTVLFEGRLRVQEPAALRAAVAQGIGPGKAYGCGLLSLARA